MTTEEEVVEVKPKRVYNLEEKRICGQIDRWLRKQSECWWLKQGAKIPNKFATQKSGTPDYFIQYHGRGVWVEVKKPGGYLRPIQKETIAKMIGAGAEVFLVRSIVELKMILEGE